MENLEGRSAIITGASRGLGYHIAQLLVSEGVNVVLTARDAVALHENAEHLRSRGARAVALPGDIADTEFLETLVGSAEDAFGPIDILVNNAGIVEYAAFCDHGVECTESVLRTNLLAPMLLARLLLPGMLSRDSGHVVNIASLSGKRGVPYTSVYSASKAGLLGWADALRLELAGTRVGVTSIVPGFVSDEGMAADHGVSPPRIAGAVRPKEVARAVVKGIHSNSREIIVRRGPSRPLYALAELSPAFGDWLLKATGTAEAHRRAAQR